MTQNGSVRSGADTAARRLVSGWIDAPHGGFVAHREKYAILRDRNKHRQGVVAIVALCEAVGTTLHRVAVLDLAGLVHSRQLTVPRGGCCRERRAHCQTLGSRCGIVRRRSDGAWEDPSRPGRRGGYGVAKLELLDPL